MVFGNIGNMIGYMLTWTTYGTWLQGDRRGWVKAGTIHARNIRLERSNAKMLKTEPVRFTKEQQAKIYSAILNHAFEKEHKIIAMAVTKNHIHLLMTKCSEEPGRLVARYKNNAKKTLGEKFTGKSVWTKGFSKRLCTGAKQLGNMIGYIKKHEPITPFVYIA